MNADERRKLKNQVIDMVRTGYTYVNIAHKLGISKRTIVTYVKEERKESIARLHATAEEHVADYEAEKNKRISKLWIIALDDKVKPGVRIKAIGLLQHEETLSIKRKQLIGMLPAEAPLIAIQNNNMTEGVTTIADSIRRKCPELLEKFHKNKMKTLKIHNEEKQKEIEIQEEKKKEEIKIEPWKTIEPQSSNVSKYSFNQEENKLRVWFVSSINMFYEYECTSEIFQEMQKAQSIGSYISQVFKGMKFEKIIEEVN